MTKEQHKEMCRAVAKIYAYTRHDNIAEAKIWAMTLQAQLKKLGLLK